MDPLVVGGVAGYSSLAPVTFQLHFFFLFLAADPVVT